SATSIRMPVGVPWPSSVSPCVTVTVLSELSVIHESICVWSGRKSAGVRWPNGVLALAACALPTVLARVLKPTISAPPPMSNFFLEISFSCMKPLMVTCLPSPSRRGLLDRRQDARIGATTAEMAVHRSADLILRRVLRRRQKIGGLDHHPVLAVAAMRHLHVDPRLLQRMQRRRSRRRAPLLRPQRGQPFEGRDRLAGDCCDRGHTASDLLAVQEHRARTALRKATTEARPVQVELVVQDIEERSVKARGHRMHETVH